MADSYKPNITTGFSAGEFTPALAGRVDFQDYKYGARLIENLLPEIQGGLKKFYGTREIAVVAEPTNYVMVPFDGADSPVVLFLHDGAVSVADGNDYYDIDLQISVNDYTKLNWQQNNDMIFFVHPDSYPFAINYLGRDQDGKHKFVNANISFKEEPYFALGWDGNFNGEITTNAETGTVTITTIAQVSGRLYLPDFLQGLSGDKNVLSETDQTAKLRASYDQTHYTVTLGTTDLQIIRKRNGTETLVSHVNTGTTKEIHNHTPGIGVPFHWWVDQYKVVNISDIVSAIQSLLPSATLVGDYISFTDSITGHQAGDEYALKITQNQSTSTAPNAPIYPYWEDIGVFYEPQIASDIFQDTNIVGRKIKFLVQHNVNTIVWAEGETVTAGEIRFASNNYYKAETSGTCGSVQPTHTQGTFSDGKINWTYLHSGTGTATVVSVDSPTQLTATVNGYLPVLVLGQNSYTWKYYQWSMWGYKQRYPTQVFFFKGRLGYFCPTAGFGCYCQMSKVDDFFDFGTETYGMNLDTDAINILMTGHNDNNVNWLLSGDRLYCGSYSGEYNVCGAKDGTLTPINVRVEAISTLGGAPVRALKFKELNLFVGTQSNEIYSISYDYTTDDYVPTNIGYMSSHLLSDLVVRWVALNNQDRNIYFRTATNRIRGINYVKEAKNLGYFRINLSGDVLDEAATNSGPVSTIYFLVKRNNVYTIEREESLNPGYMLCEKFTDLVSLTPQTYPEFASQVVWIKNTDTGAFYKTQLGVNGEFDNHFEWLKYSIGLPMVCRLDGQPMFGEKLEGFQQKSTAFTIRLRNSGAFSYGTSHDFDKFYEYSNWGTQAGQQYDAPHKLMTGDIQIPAPSGYMQKANQGDSKYPNDTGIALNLRMDTPEPFNILMIGNVYV